MRRGILRRLDAELVAEIFAHAYRRVAQLEFLTASNLSIAEAHRQVGSLLIEGLLRRTERHRLHAWT